MSSPPLPGKISTKPPSGMRDYLPRDLARRAHVIELIRRTYRAYGFVELETPSIENLSTLLGKYGEEGDQLLYRLLHRRDALRRAVEKAHAEGRPVSEPELADQGLRYDLTVPLARVLAQNADLPRYFKRFQIQPVWRADRPGKGRFREFLQCDVDITGTKAKIADAEVINAAADVLTRLGFTEFSLPLNHRELLRAMIRTANIDPSDETTALIALDKLDKIGRDQVLAELGTRGIAAASAQRLLALSCDLPATSNDQKLDYLAEQVKDEPGQQAIAELRELCRLCQDGPAGSVLSIETELARGLSYYTGPIFEIRVPDLAGSLGGGGRYDELVGMFGKREVPAVGFSLGLERILTVMGEREMFPTLDVGPDLLLCWMGVEPTEVLRVAHELRTQNLRVEVYPEPAKLKKQLGYAANAEVGARFAVILGSDELKDGQVTIKDLGSGEQTRVATGKAATVINPGSSGP